MYEKWILILSGIKAINKIGPLPNWSPIGVDGMSGKKAKFILFIFFNPEQVWNTVNTGIQPYLPSFKNQQQKSKQKNKTKNPHKTQQQQFKQINQKHVTVLCQQFSLNKIGQTTQSEMVANWVSRNSQPFLWTVAHFPSYSVSFHDVKQKGWKSSGKLN